MEYDNSNMFGIDNRDRQLANSMNFNPLSICSMLRDVLRTFFFEFGDTFSGGYLWDPDPKRRKIEIGTLNDLNSDSAVGSMPRVLIGRGQISSRTQFLGGGLETVEVTSDHGDKTKYFRQDIMGQISIVIEANGEGPCEIIAETIRRYLMWSRDMFEGRFGFQRFGSELSISECMMDKEDREKFKIQMALPYSIEDRWRTTEFQLKLKHAFIKLASN